MLQNIRLYKHKCAFSTYEHMESAFAICNKFFLEQPLNASKDTILKQMLTLFFFNINIRISNSLKMNIAQSINFNQNENNFYHPL